MRNNLLCIFLFASLSGFAQDTYRAINGGDFNDPNIWTCADGFCNDPIPGSDDHVIIPKGWDITVNSTQEIASLTLFRRNLTNGARVFLQTDANLTILGDLNINDSQSSFNIGSGAVFRIAGNINNNGGLSIDPYSSFHYLGSGEKMIYPLTYGSLVINKPGGTAYLNSDLTVNSLSIINGVLDADENSIFIGGNLSIINNGQLSSSDASIYFNGSSPQSISGSTSTTVGNLIISNDVNNNHTNLNVTNSITFTGSGNYLDADGSGSGVLTLLSHSETETAYVGELINGNEIAGEITLQRYIASSTVKNGPNAGDEEVWRYLTTPLNGVTVADWQDEIAITGYFDEASTCTGCNSSSPSLFSYHEPVDGHLNEGYDVYGFPAGNNPGGSNSTTFERGRGYAIWIRDFDLNQVLDMRGTIEGGSFSDFTISYTPSTPDPDHGSTPAEWSWANDGWNLIGNPFLSPIDYDNSGWNWGEDMINAVYIKDNYGKVVDNSDDYIVYNGTVIAGADEGSWDGVMAIGQAFWVKAEGNSDANLTLTQEVKTNQNPQHLFRIAKNEKRPEDPSHVLRVFLNHNGFNDEAVVHFREDATEELDMTMDAPKLHNSRLNISTLLENQREMVINSLPFSSLVKDIGLALHPQNPKGEYTISFEGYETFDNDLQVLIIDTYENKEEIVTKGESYSFNVTEDEASFGKDRFRIRFSNVVLATETDKLNTGIRIYPNPAHRATTIDLTDGPANLVVMSIDGKTLHTQSLSQGSNIVNLEKLEKGIYLLRITGESVNYSERIIKY